MVEMEEPERAAAGEEEALILRGPGAEEIAFERSARARFFPLHGRHAGGIAKACAGAQAFGAGTENDAATSVRVRNCHA